MKTEGEKTNFDLSVLSLNDLVKVYEDITEFLRSLNEKKIVKEKKEQAGKKNGQ